MTSVAVYSYTQSVTYVADNILKSLKDIIRLSGLDPAAFVDGWDLHKRGISAWLGTGDLQKVVLEIYDPRTDGLILRWDIDIAYQWTGGDGSFFTDTEQLRYAIRKAGIAPSEARYRLVLDNKPGRPDVDGWRSICSGPASPISQPSGTPTLHSCGRSGAASPGPGCMSFCMAWTSQARKQFARASAISTCLRPMTEASKGPRRCCGNCSCGPRNA